MNLANILLETIKETDIDKYKREFGSFTKNFTRIKNGRDLHDVFNAYIIWTRMFENFVYNKLLGTELVKKAEDDKPLRKAAWALTVIRRDEIFLPKEARWLINKMEDHDLNYKGSAPYNDLWEEAYIEWSKRKQSKYTLLSRLGNDTFKALYNYIHKVGEAPDRYEKEYRSYVGGSRVEIVSGETTKTNFHADFVKTNLENIKKAYDIMKGQFAKVFKGVTFVIDKERESNIAAAHYDQYADEIVAFGWATEKTPRTIIHELGHRWWFKVMSEQQRERWIQFFKEQRVYFTREEMNEIEKAFWKNYKSIEDGENLWVDLTDFLYDGLAKTKFESLMIANKNKDELFTHDKKRDKEQAQRNWDFFEREMMEQPIMLTPTTFYGATKDVESYAEAFMLYNVRRDKMDPLLLQTFKLVTF